MKCVTRNWPIYFGAAVILVTVIATGIAAHGQALPGDMNCDGVVDGQDVAPFSLALNNPAAYAATYPDCDINNADINDDGQVDAKDRMPFLALLGRLSTPALSATGLAAVTLLLLLLGTLGLRRRSLLRHGAAARSVSTGQS